MANTENANVKGESYVDIGGFFVRVISNWAIILLCAVIGGVLAFIYSKYMATPMYSSSVNISVYNGDLTKVTTSDLTASQDLMESVTYILKDNYTSQKIADVLQERKDNSEFTKDYDFSASTIGKSLSYSPKGNSFVLSISAKTADAEESAIICNAAAAVVPEVIAEFIPNSQVKTMGEAKVNRNPVSPAVTKNILLGFVAGIVLVCGVLFVATVLDNRVSDEEDLKMRFGIVVLGDIPNLEELKKRG